MNKILSILDLCLSQDQMSFDYLESDGLCILLNLESKITGHYSNFINVLDLVLHINKTVFSEFLDKNNAVKTIFLGKPDLKNTDDKKILKKIIIRLDKSFKEKFEDYFTLDSEHYFIYEDFLRLFLKVIHVYKNDYRFIKDLEYLLSQTLS